MKNLTNALLLVVVVILSSFASTANAQNSNTAYLGASATIVVPVSMAKTSDLQINMPNQSNTNNNTSKKTANSNKGEVVAAAFTVSGYANYAYSVTLPSTVTISNGNRSITIGTEINSTTRALSSNGIDNLSISGKVSFNNDPSSMFAMNSNKEEKFPVTVVYN